MKAENMKEHQLIQRGHKRGYVKGFEKGINITLKLVYEVMNEEYGFGDKRLDRLEDGVLNKLKGLEEMGND